MRPLPASCSSPACWRWPPPHSRPPTLAVARRRRPLGKDALSAAIQQALQALLDGNARCVAGNAVHPNQDAERRAVVATKQEPFAIILT